MQTEDFSDLTKEKPDKRLTKGRKRSHGRDRYGHISVRHKGGGHKRVYRLVDFKRLEFLDLPAKVEAIEYDPNRSARIALICYKNGQRRYILAPQGLKVGDKVIASKKKLEFKIGDRTILANIADSTSIYNLEFQPNKGGQTVRSAGTSAILQAKEGKYAQVRLPSGEIRNFLQSCMASVGILSNFEHNNIVVGKAGRQRWKGIRPTVRGKAMNPVDHPHGGGEGNTSIGLKHPKTPWGKPALGVKTRKKKKWSNKLILKRRK